MAKFDVLNTIVKKNKQPNFKELKQKNGIVEDADMMSLLISCLYDRIENFNINTKYDKNAEIKKIIDYISYNKTKLNLSEHNNKLVYKDLKEIIDKIDKIIANPGEKINLKEADCNLVLLENIRKKLYEHNSTLFADNDKINKEELYETYTFVLEHIKEPNKYKAIEQIIKEKPKVIEFDDVDGKTLFMKIVDLFTKSFIDNEDYNQKLHYQKFLILCIKYSQSPVKQSGIYPNLKYLNTYVDSGIKTNFQKEGERILIDEVSIKIKERSKNDKDFERIRTRLEKKYQLQKGCTEKDIKNLKLPTNNIYNDYADHTKEYTITIDSKETKNFEDAFSLKRLEDGFLLRIYAVDMSNYLEPDNDVYNYALEIGSQYFLPLSILDMNVILKENEVRPVICHEFEFDRDFSLIKTRLLKAKIKVDKNYYYSDFISLLNSGDALANDYYYVANNLHNITKQKPIQKARCSSQEKLSAGSSSTIVSNIINYARQELTKQLELPLICKQSSLIEKELKEKCNLHFENDYESAQIKKILTTLSKETNDKKEFSIREFNKNNQIADLFAPARKADSLINQKLLVLHIDEKNMIEKAYLEVTCDKLNNKLLRENDYDEELKREKKRSIDKNHKKY